MQMEGEDDECGDDRLDEDIGKQMEEEEEGGQISLHALEGHPSEKTIKIRGNVGKRKLLILIDSGSSHSFLDESTTKELLCVLQPTIPLYVTVATGHKMISRYKCQGFTWRMQGYEFFAELRILQLGGCQVVLGVDWMKTVNPLIFDFNTLEVTFDKGGRRVTLTGSGDGGKCRAISSSHLQKLIEQEGGTITQLHSVYAVEVWEGRPIDDTMGSPWFKIQASANAPIEVPFTDSLHSLLVEFEELFLEPTSLPPDRFLEHTIHLKPNTEPINVCSYHYSSFQKAEIERLVKEMLSKKVIRLSQSPFASPVLLVKKKEGN